MGKLVTAIKARGVWPFAPGNRIHVVPPLVIGDDDLREGLAVIDEALSVADELVS
jgi:taurine--2-oxoglutarate transaminase